MSTRSDQQLGMGSKITRRDFLNGIAVSVAGIAAGNLISADKSSAAAAGLFPQENSGYYPPALTGMRGSAAGSFESAHALRDGAFWQQAGAVVQTKEVYDLLIVGSGISGLAAAYFFQKQNKAASILLIDNHDDFGGHATRNEFRPGGRLLLVNGGSSDIESPFPFSKIAHTLMQDLGINPVQLAKKTNPGNPDKQLGSAYFFDKETFGADKLLVGEPGRSGSRNDWQSYLKEAPLAPQVQRDIVRLHEATPDYMPDLSSEQKKDRLSRISYKEYLLKVAQVSEETIPFFQTDTQGLFGVGIDAVPALDCWVLQLPGFSGLKLKPGPHLRMGYTARGYATPKPPYSYHFPDGNATIARLLLRTLIPEVFAANKANEIVIARADYSKLDLPEAKVRLRLSSTAVRVRHIGEPESAGEVEISYVRNKQVYSVHAKNVVMACWNSVIPYLCPELPVNQKDALHYGTKVPLVYTNVALKNWQSFQNLGVSNVNCPGMYHTYMWLDRAVGSNGYKPSLSPGEPVVLRMQRYPCMPGLSEKEQHKIGRAELLSTSFETFERNIRDQLQRILAPGGFDPARDIEAITVNRWPHGYAYEYNSLYDPDWPPGEQPCEIARKPFGRITIANADAAAAAYVDQSIDQAYRAVQELKQN